MRLLLITLFSFVVLQASTWQNLDSNNQSSSISSSQDNNLNQTVLEYQLDGFHLIPVDTPNGEMYVVKLEEGASLLEEGAPDLQKFAKSIVVPDDKQMSTIVIDSDYVEYENILLAPSKGNLSRSINPSDIEFNFGSQYETDAFYPGELVELEDPYVLRDLRGQSVVFYPIQYNPIKQILRVYSNIQVEVRAVGPGVVNVLNRTSLNPVYSKEFIDIYENHFLNFQNDNRFDYLVDHGNMLIISYGTFMETVQPLVDWKNRKGISTEMINVSEIGLNSSAIENFVDDYYEDNGLTFLLLIGDIAQIPSPSVSGSASDPSYGFIEGNDSYAEVIVGRLSGSTPSQIQTQVERSINYERYPQAGVEWYDNALGVASNQGPGFGGYTDDDFNDFLWDTVLSDFTYDSYEGIYDGSGGTANQGINAINNGVSLINYTGHGSISSWGNGAPLSTSNVNSLTNNNLLPFVITVGCNVGEFNSTNECYAEAWLRATNNGEPTGAISHFGSTISQSWEPPMHGQYAMNLILTESYDNNITRTMGGITTNGCMYMNDAQGSGGINETNYWTYFGDPSVPIRTAPPVNMSLNHDDVIILGSSEFVVDTGNEGDLIALSRDGELLTSGYTNGFGFVTLDVTAAATIPGEIDLVATGFNNFPYETTVMVLSPEGPYVTVNNTMVEAGYDDVIEYGELVNLSLMLENVGSDPANNLSIQITTDDLFVTITNGTTSAGYVGANGTITATGLSFVVSENIPNNHSIDINCSITSNGENWESNLNFTAFAPVLDVVSVVGDLDPGQTTDMEIMVMNNGGTQIIYPVVSVSGDSYVTINNSSFSNAYSLEVGMDATLTMSVSVSPSTPIGHLAEFSISILADLGDGPETNTTFSVPVGQITANFESGLGNLDWDLSCGGIGCGNWDLDMAESNSGSASIRSGVIGDSQTSDLSVTLDVTADGVIEFNYKVSAEYSTSGNYFYDGLEFYVDGNLEGQYQTNTDGSSPWTNVSHSVSAGEHTFRWTFVKDAAGGGTDCVNTDCADAVWIDDIIFPPAYMESDMIMGDLNGDTIVNILDVIIMVNIILEVEMPSDQADLNGDGIVNILDVVQVINLILGPRFDDASVLEILNEENKILLESDGYVGAIKMILNHENHFSIDLTRAAFVADYNTMGNRTTILIVAPETKHLFDYEGDFDIVHVEAANSNSFIDVTLPSKTSLSKAYPNPFNPITNINYELSQESYVVIDVFNISGQLIENLLNGNKKSGNYDIQWDASLYPSGMYFVKMKVAGDVFSQKVMLMK